jgi:hypothetical protein
MRRNDAGRAAYQRESATPVDRLTLPDKVQQDALAAQAPARVLEQVQDNGGKVEQRRHHREHEKGALGVDETCSVDLHDGEDAGDEYEEIGRVELLN